ncbi:MAG: hypothetical protein FD155_1975 [Bacteroidetes bacterium]|nr:MAG: hypothetical protein FD155_1975 [Bacteroidota bacterium]
MRFFYQRVMLFAFILFAGHMMAQTQSELEILQASRNEFYFELNVSDQKEFETINKMVSIDAITQNGCIAYANPLQFARLLSAGYKPTLLMPPSLQYPNQPMMDVADIKSVNDWNTYPTYPAYLAMMQQFATNYPDLCTIQTIGTLNSGRQIIAARINNGTPLGKPEFLYTSSIHGDETTGYVLMLRLIDYLLQNYGNDPVITQLVDNVDIWINPLANPDGTYYGGNNTVNGAIRGNSNGIDLNRNYADPEDGQHPDGNAWQPETVHFMQFGEDRNFSMSANFHGGAEVLNYPWDTWSRLHADNNWWIYVCREYADTAHIHAPSGYLSDFDNGITNGYAWYTISGGRQDYMNYFEQCREVTIEISNIKLLPASQLPVLWEYNYRSLINYMEQAMFGFHGIVTDTLTGEPIEARVDIIGHDLDNSYVRTSLPAGNYSRPVKAGTYNLTFSAEGYYSKTISNLTIGDQQTINLDVELVPGTVIADFTANAYQIPKGGQVNFFDNSFGQNIVSWQWVFEGAEPSVSTLENPVNITYPNAGEYDVQLTITNGSGVSSTILKPDLVSVTSMYIMSNGTYTTCEGTFFDPGGPSNEYGNNQQMTMTIVPDTEEALTKVEFTMFDLEAQSNCDYDWLKIYNGLNTSAPLLGTWCGTNSPGTIIANNGGKGLTFQFFSDGSVVEAGWAATISCFSTVGAEELEKNKVIVYPNPAVTFVQIKTTDNIREVKVLDQNGKTIIDNVVGDVNNYQLDIRSLNPGIYMLQITSGTTTWVQKLSVNR